MPKVTIYSRPGCCLCDEVKDKLQRLRQRAEFELEEINVDDNVELRRLYSDQVPVVMIDGRKAFKFRLDSEEFLRKLAARSL